MQVMVLDQINLYRKDGIIKPFQYLSKAQAEKKAVSIGGGEVLRLTGAGAYYVVPKIIKV